MSSPLPVAALDREIVERTLYDRRLVLAAPPGSGKSTLVPGFFLSTIEKPILVLEPRRLAARSLAAFVASQSNEEAGGRIGYRVRHEQRLSKSTRIIYETYGLFLQHALSDPLLMEAGLVILDEFHERSLEMDLALSWLTRLYQEKKGPPFIVMSATLDTKSLCDFLFLSGPVTADARVYPVEIIHQLPKAAESSPEQAVRAVRSLLQAGQRESILVFMPGMAEIRTTCDRLRDAGISVPVFPLHGSQSLAEQTQVLRATSKGLCVIVSTNVAETSLTIPGVRAAVDSGYERRAAYDPIRDRNTLYRKPISLSSATQRAGRAGREGPGRCIRLYSKETELGMALSVPPEITRLELSGLILKILGLSDKSGLPYRDPFGLSWLTPPDSERFEQALILLGEIGAVETTHGAPLLTDAGSDFLRWPLDPLEASLLADADKRGSGRFMAAVLALWENEEFDEAADCRKLAEQFLEDSDARVWTRDTRKTFEALMNALPGKRTAVESGKGDPYPLEASFLFSMRRRLAIRDGETASFRFKNQTTATLLRRKKGDDLPDALVALDIIETMGANRSRNIVISAYIPVDPEKIPALFPARCEKRISGRWDEKKKAVVFEQEVLFDGQPVLKGAAGRPDSSSAQEILAGKCASGEIDLKDDSIRALLARIALVASAFPEKGVRTPDTDDWKLIYHSLCRGKIAAADLSPEKLLTEILSYFGPGTVALLDSMTPERVDLPSGKKGRIHYPEKGPPELSARITDFLGYRGAFTVCKGRVAGIFDILAPNYRTVQKTADLEGFWKTIYPELKNSLRRKYPRHPWP